MLAGKQFDLVTGIDIHIITTPAGVPVPIPHPFIGMVFDVFDFIPFIGSAVYVNNIIRAAAGTEGRNLPFHIPIGGAFSIPPGNDCEIFMGSATVLVEGEPFTYQGLPALSCQTVGMPSVPRKAKKPKKPILYLPTSFVIPIPKGSPVLIGGPPTINMMAMATKLGFKMLGKLKKTKMMKAISKKAHDAAAAMMKKAKIPNNVRNMVHRAICFVTGHPVDIPTGKVFTDTVDFELPGPIPLKWERVWYSTSTYEGPIGHGWHHNYDVKLLIDEYAGVVIVLLADGRTCVFDMPFIGENRYDRKEKLTLLQDEHGFVLQDESKLNYRFTKCATTEQTWNLKTIESSTGHKISFNYNANDHLNLITDSAGRKIKVTTDPIGKITEIKTANNGEEILLARYGYNHEGDLVRFTDALDKSAVYQYENHCD